MTSGKSPLGQLWPAPVFGKTKKKEKKKHLLLAHSHTHSLMYVLSMATLALQG